MLYIKNNHHTRNPKNTRNREIFSQYMMNPDTCISSIAKMHQLSPQRVRYIIQRQFRNHTNIVGTYLSQKLIKETAMTSDFQERLDAQRESP